MRLRLATLNVWGLPEPFSVDPVRRVRAIGDHLAPLEADVVAFQEVWFAGLRRRLLEAGRRAGLPHAWSSGAQLGGSGLLVLSRLPIQDASFTPFVLRGQPEQVTHGDYYGGKGYVRVRLATPAGPISVVDTHLHARYASHVEHAYRACRAGQAVQLAVGTAGVDEPLIAAGDFNFVPGTDLHTVLTGLSGLRDLAHELGSAEPTVLRSNPFRYGSHKPSRRVDYVFARDGGAARVRPVEVRRVFAETLGSRPFALSDHAGVLAEVSIEPGATARSWRPERRAIELARQLLAEGRREAEQRQQSRRSFTAAGLGAAGLFALGDRRLAASTTRRRFLRAGLRLAAVSSLAPSLGAALLSEVFVPEEIHAYEALSLDLERMAETLDRVDTA